jgi:hypothetical protein
MCEVFMTREPLMLSDTAMVLLRQYSEMNTDYWVTQKALSQVISRVSKEYDRAKYEWFETHNHSHIIGAVQSELMHEIWLLWTFRDMPIVHYLEWHLVFNLPLMTMAEKTFILPHEYPRRNIRSMTKKSMDTTWFLETLEIAYTKALALRTQTKTTP